MLTGLRRRVRHASFRSRSARLTKDASATASPFEVFHGMPDDWWVWANTAGRDRLEIAAHLPTMPDPELQRRITGADGDATMREALSFFKLVKQTTDRYSAGGFAACRRIVDFGCGWGRITRCFMKDVEPSGLIGLDCVDSVLDVARTTNPWTKFVLTDPDPPSPLETGGADLVYCYSVFSHLSEEAHLRWVAEFHRLLRPGGLLIATTRPRSFLYRYGELRGEDGLEIQDRVTSRAFPGDPEPWLERYDRGEFLFAGVGVGQRLTGDFYGEALVSRTYAERAWSPRFELVDYISDSARCVQDVLVARRQV